MATQTQSISFRNGPISMAGELRLPDGFTAGNTYAALVIVTPGSSVKEKIGAVYGERMAGEGFINLAFDPSYQGQSGGGAA